MFYSVRVWSRSSSFCRSSAVDRIIMIIVFFALTIWPFMIFIRERFFTSLNTYYRERATHIRSIGTCKYALLKHNPAQWDSMGGRCSRKNLVDLICIVHIWFWTFISVWQGCNLSYSDINIWLKGKSFIATLCLFTTDVYYG